MVNLDFKQAAPIAGILTCLTLYSVILVAAITFVGEQNETYSIWNHFISELGSLRFSKNHTIYNSGIILSSMGFALFTYGIGHYIDDCKQTKLGIKVGLLSSVFCIFVGFVPEDYRYPHLILALCFFSLLAIATVLFAWSIWKGNSPFSKLSGLHGFTIPVLFSLFMMMPKELMSVKRIEGPNFIRPEIWWLPFFEWLIFIALTTWIFSISIQMLRLRK